MQHVTAMQHYDWAAAYFFFSSFETGRSLRNAMEKEKIYQMHQHDTTMLPDGGRGATAHKPKNRSCGKLLPSR
jgi:hypothetical protein